jgi:predicted phage terminase large subunit-like protein
MAFTSMTGSRGDRVILDDPLSVDDANSKAALLAAESTFREALPTRVNNDESAIVVIMQRLHEKDTSGIILAEKLPYVHLMLPMRFESTRRCSNQIFTDPRKTEGELLFPERFPEQTVTELEKTLGEYATAGQLQQRPSPAGGGILKLSHFQLWPTNIDLPSFEYVVQSVDPAYTEKTTGDPSAFTAWGVFTHKGKRGAMLLDAWADHMGYPQLRAKLVEEWHATYGKSDSRKGKKADALLIEQKASGQSLIQDLRQANLPAVPYLPTSDKISRAHQVAPILELDCLWLPESRNEGGKPVTWAREFLKQVEQFPNAEHDDYVDSLSQCIIYLRDDGWFEMPFAALDEIDEIDYHALKKRKENPYAA